MKLISPAVVACAVGVLFSTTARSAVWVGNYNFDTGIPVGWLETGGANAPTALPGGPGSSVQYMQIAFPGFPIPPDSIVYTANGLPDNLSFSQIAFDFKYDTAAPSQFGLYIVASGNQYLYEFTPSATWSSYSAMLLDGTGWDPQFVGPYNFAADIASVTQIGIYIMDNGGGNTYSLDNFRGTNIPVPEPGSIFMLGAAFMSMGMVFRRRLTAAVSALKNKAA